MKRMLAVLVGAGVAVGGGAAAWASPGGSTTSGPNREAAKACFAQGGQALPGADKAALRASVEACLKAAGITPGKGHQPTPAQQAKREVLTTCLKGVKTAHPTADKAGLRDLARPCLDAAGITPGEHKPGGAKPGRVRAKVAGARECLAKVKAANPSAEKNALHDLVKECVKAK